LRSMNKHAMWLWYRVATSPEEQERIDQFWRDQRDHSDRYQKDPGYKLEYNRKWAGYHEVEMAGDKMVLWHGTRSALEIRQSGVFRAGTHFAEDPEYAMSASTRYNGSNPRRKTVVMKVLVPLDAVTCSIHVTSDREIPVEEI
jgi:hypothetical protein